VRGPGPGPGPGPLGAAGPLKTIGVFCVPVSYMIDDLFVTLCGYEGGSLAPALANKPKGV